MGTRHLIAVVLDGEYKVAQYGQWDGYLTGQGNAILKFLGQLGGDDNLACFEKNLRRCKFITDSDIIRFREDENSQETKQFIDFADRDIGSKILYFIRDYELDETIYLRDSITFGADSLFCEYAYVIDLDNKVLEVYTGFNRSPIDSSERFASIPPETDGYYQVKLFSKYNFSELPENFKAIEDKINENYENSLTDEVE